VDRTRLTRWLIPLPAILFALTAQTVNAEPILGIETTYYTIDEIPPTQSDTEYLVCGTEVENNINRNYDYELFEDCTGDLFMVHMAGFIDIPEHDTIEFMLATDDGGEMEIDGNTFGNWNDQGCSWMESGELILESGSNAFNVWMYEHGGNSCIMLAWNIDNEGWAIVPDEVFTTNNVSTTTTTVQETTTSWEPSTTSTTTTTTSTTIAETTSVPVTTITVIPSTAVTITTEPVQISTTTSTTTTTTTTTTTVPTTTTTTEPPYTPTQTSTTIPTIEIQPVTTVNETETIVVVTETTEPETFITDPEEITVPDTTEPETFVTLPETITVPDTTEPETTTTYPDGPVEDTVETTIPETFVSDILDEILLDEKEQQTQPLQPEEDISETTLLEVESSSTTSVLFLKTEIVEDEPISSEQFSAIIESIDEATPEQVTAIIETVLNSDVSSDQAAELVSNVAVLQVITESDAKELFSEVVPAELSEEQAALIVEAVQSAPKEVRKAFEAVIDIFGSQFESYVPTGSNIPVSERRTLVAIGATLTMLPAPRVRR
jgi:hypothetical protein